MALAETIKENLLSKRAVSVPQLGIFDIKHQSSIMEAKEDGTNVLTPPKDDVIFTPSTKHNSEI